jgi:hypothetical protein
MTLWPSLAAAMSGTADAAGESLPWPTVLVVVYGLLWLGLVAGIAWLATRGHALDRDARALGAQLQAQLDRTEDRAGDTD